MQVVFAKVKRYDVSSGSGSAILESTGELVVFRFNTRRRILVERSKLVSRSPRRGHTEYPSPVRGDEIVFIAKPTGSTTEWWTPRQAYDAAIELQHHVQKHGDPDPTSRILAGVDLKARLNGEQ